MKKEEKLFEEFENVVLSSTKQFKNIKKFSYVGLIGSCNPKRDLDLLILPANNLKIGEFIKRNVEFLEILERKLKERNIGLVIFTSEWSQEEVNWISKRNSNKDIFLHLISNFGWQRDEKTIKEILIKAVKSTNKTYYGDINYIKKIKNLKPSIDYTHLFFSNCFFSRYPKELETKKIQEMAKFILKIRGEKISFPDLNNKELYFYMCDYLDNHQRVPKLEASKKL